VQSNSKILLELIHLSLLLKALFDFNAAKCIISYAFEFVKKLFRAVILVTLVSY